VEAQHQNRIAMQMSLGVGLLMLGGKVGRGWRRDRPRSSPTLRICDYVFGGVAATSLH
jgi:hypothetical protein